MTPEKEHLEIHEVYIRHRTELCRYVINKVNVSNDEAQDIVQAAFARVIEMDFSEIKNPRALLYKTSYNIALTKKDTVACARDIFRRWLIRMRKWWRS